ncbi:MAG: MATE family efflux transporter [Chitinophagaceae bacterium]
MQQFNATLKLALPIILGNLVQVGLGLIDSAMVGAVSYKLLAASSLVNNVIGIPQVMGIGLSMGITPLIAIAQGQRNVAGISRLLGNGVVMMLIAGLLLVAILVPSYPMLFHMRQDAEVAALSVPYYITMAVSLLPMLLFMAFKQFADGLQHTSTAMLISLLALPINGLLNWLFIFGHWGFPRWELFGAGAATLITRVLMMLAMWWVVAKHRWFKKYVANVQWRSLWHIATLQQLLKLGIPSSLQYTMEVAAFSVSGIMVGWLGATQQAAHQIALNCASTTFMVALGFSVAGSIRVSYAYGQSNQQQMLAIGKSTLLGGVLYGVICALGLAFGNEWLPQIFTNENMVMGLAANLLLYAALFQISDAAQAIGVGLCRGRKDVKVPTIFVAIAYWVIGIPTGYYLAFVHELQAAGIWLGLVAGLTTSGLLLNIRFFNQIYRKVA